MSERTYRFGPLEQRGVLGPVRLGQACVVGATTVGAVVVLDAAPSVAGATTAVALVLVGLLVALLPVARRTVEEWAPVVAGYLARRLGGRTQERSPIPLMGLTVGPRLRGPGAGEPRHAICPAPLRGVAITEVAYGARTIGALREHRGRRLTAVIACRATGFSLLDPDTQVRRLTRWGEILAGAAGGAVRRLGWIERTAPAPADELARWLHSERDPALPPRGTPIVESYLELISGSARVAREHEILVTVQVDARTAGGTAGSGARPVELALIEEADRLADALEAAEVTVLGALDHRALARTIRTAYDPYARAELAGLEAADPERRGLAEAHAWPLGTDERWDHLRTDGALHATFWIGAWPRIDVSPMFLDGLISRSGGVRTVAVTFAPIPIARSARDAEAAVTRDRADRELRHRFGQSETARRRQVEDSALRREAEIAAGHAEVRFAGYVTVTGRDTDDLRRACADVQDQAARARLELHRLYGQQATAFTFTLPLCRGLR